MVPFRTHLVGGMPQPALQHPPGHRLGSVVSSLITSTRSPKPSFANAAAAAAAGEATGFPLLPLFLLACCAVTAAARDVIGACLRLPATNSSSLLLSSAHAWRRGVLVCGAALGAGRGFFAMAAAAGDGTGGGCGRFCPANVGLSMT